MVAAAKGVALITGASSGIGEAYADRLADRGHDLILVARRRDRLEAIATQIRDWYGCTVEIETADLAEGDDLHRLEARLRERADITVLVNNAGIGAGGPSTAVAADDVEALVRINVLALTRLCLAAGPAFLARGGGTIINIGSIIAFNTTLPAAAYSGSKAYVLNFSRTLQTEYADTGVKVQVVLPGPVRTEFFGDRAPPFPDHMFMTPGLLADIGLSALDQGELICLPTLHDLDAWTAFEQARLDLRAALTQDALAPARYRLAAPEATS